MRETGEALHYAHGQGLIHRDVKPENVLLSQGHALVADFGIARAAGVAAGDRLTQPGLSMGTPAYMSPEQTGGDREVDARADQYSLACVLYELLAGQPPFTGPDAGRGAVAPAARPGAAAHHAPPRRAGVGAAGRSSGRWPRSRRTGSGRVLEFLAALEAPEAPRAAAPRRSRPSWCCRSPT